jgi:hypothetical protein
MTEPIEAEMAIPPIYTDEQESAIRDQDVEPPSTPDSGASQVNQDLEKGQGEIVKFAPGESPRESSAGKKWYVPCAPPRGIPR